MPGISVVFRTDSSISIGSGHLRRCLTLAENLRKNGAEVTFISRDLPGNLNSFVEGQGFRVLRLPTDDAMRLDWVQDAREITTILGRLRDRPQWLVVDHYELDAQWERQLRPHVDRILVVDDYANRPHDCDAILDQNFYRDFEKRYDTYVERDCKKLLGTRYVLLRDEFLKIQNRRQARGGRVKRVLLFFGGMDETNETQKALEGLLSIQNIALDVVVGATYPHLAGLKKILSPLPHAHLHVQTDRMAELMAAADLYVGSGGASTWERCYLGLPSLVVTTTEGQVRANVDLAAEGYLDYLGMAQDISKGEYSKRVLDLMKTPEKLLSMSARGLDLVDGRGVERVSQVLLNPS